MTINVYHKALTTAEKISEKQTKCYFKDIFTGKETSLTLAISVSQILEWKNGTPTHIAFSTLSKDVRDMFDTGLTTNDFGRLLERI